MALVPRGSPEGGKTLFFASWALLYAASFITFLSLGKKRESQNLVILGLIGVGLAVAVFSSVEPRTSIIYSVALFCNILVAYQVSCEYSIHEICVILARIFLALCVLGLLAYYIRYSGVYYLDAHRRPNYLGGAPYRGFTAHKIIAGLYGSIGAVAVMAAYRGLVRLLGVVAFGLSVALAGSAIGALLFASAFPVFAAIKAAGAGRLRLSVAATYIFAVSLPVLYFSFKNIDQLVGILGRDPTFTGRTTLWRLGYEAWLQRPILGWGFNAYLNSDAGDVANWTLNKFSDWDIPHFHESYIQTAVDFGIVGLFALTAIIFYVLKNSYQYAVSTDLDSGTFAFTVTIILSMAGFVMFIFLNYNHLATFILLLLFFALRRQRGICRGA